MKYGSCRSFCFTGDCGVRNVFIESGDIKNLTSADYPNPYSNDLLCKYEIESVEGKYLLVDILDFELERGYDFLEFGNGEGSSDSESMIARLTGTTKIRRLILLTSKMWIKFITDRTGTRRGFNVHFREKYNEGMFI